MILSIAHLKPTCTRATIRLRVIQRVTLMEHCPIARALPFAPPGSPFAQCSPVLHSDCEVWGLTEEKGLGSFSG